MCRIKHKNDIKRHIYFLYTKMISLGEIFLSSKKCPDERSDWGSYKFILVHNPKFSGAVMLNTLKIGLSMASYKSVDILVLATRYCLMLLKGKVFLF